MGVGGTGSRAEGKGEGGSGVLRCESGSRESAQRECQRKVQEHRGASSVRAKRVRFRYFENEVYRFERTGERSPAGCGFVRGTGSKCCEASVEVRQGSGAAVVARTGTGR